MKNTLLYIFFSLVLLTGVMSCQALESLFGEGTVLTTADQVLEGGEAAVIPTDQLPDSITSQFPEGTVFVVTDEDSLVDDAVFVPVDGELNEGTFDVIVKTALGIAGTFIPGLAAWEGVLTLFSKRKRKHYLKAAKAIVPTDKKIDLGGALASLASALGAAHSSAGTAILSDEEDLEEEELS